MKCIWRFLFIGITLFCICFTEVHAGPYSALSEMLLKGAKTKGLRHAVTHEAYDYSLTPGAYRIAVRHIINQKDSIAKTGYFVLNEVVFDSGSVKSTKESETALIKVAEVMRSHPKIMYEIIGHTDGYECEDSCLLLSARRAAYVRSFLINMGVSEMRLTIKGMGSSKLLSTDSTPEGRSLNRRVEFLRIDKIKSSSQSSETIDSLVGTIIVLLIPLVLIVLLIVNFKQKRLKRQKEEETYRKIAEWLDKETKNG